ncbi:hypothetical protein AWB81_07960 [Caballeronia arationis]|nr:hypothetical protein AWB81_07960 [Caballeronia arationis]
MAVACHWRLASSERVHSVVQRSYSYVLHIDFSSNPIGATNLRHAEFVARADVHLFLCELFDVKLKCRQPGNLDGKQRVGDAKLMEACLPVTNAYRQGS